MFSGCFDLDEMAIDMGFYQEKRNVNQRVNVILRTPKGVVCLDDETVVNRWIGDKVTFNVRIDNNYIYIGNSGGAIYNPETKKLIIESVKAPTTMDIEVVDKNDVYYIEILGRPSSVEIEYVQGNQWSYVQQEVTILAKIPDNFVFLGWSVGDTLDRGGFMLCETEQLVYTPSKRGINKIYINLKTVD
jgi:hypothetical protein